MLLSLLLPLAGLAADPAPRVVVVVTPNPVTEGESVQLRFEVDSAQTAAVFQPNFDSPDFIQLGTSYGANATQIYSGGQVVAKKKTFYEYVLSPKKSGVLFIRDIHLKVGNQEVRSADVMVKVLPDTTPGVKRPQAPARPQMPGFFGSEEEEEDFFNPAAPGFQGGAQAGPVTPPVSAAPSGPDKGPSSFNSDFTVFASLSEEKAYVGEPIVIEYWLYDFGGLRQVEVQKWPSFNGFWKEDLEITNRFEFDEVVAGGRMARRAFISRYALYGIKPGKISPDKLVIRGQYVSNTVMQGFFQTQQVRTGIHGNQELKIEILPLPTAGRPDKFGGAVGQFFLKAEADKTTVAQHTPITFTVTLQGTGNFQGIDNIRLPMPPDFEIYESKTGARDAAPIGMRRELDSQKIFTITAVPRKAGTFRIEPLTWWYFDPAKETYEKLSTNPIDVTVTPNAAGAEGTNTYSAPGAPGASSTPADLRPMKSLSSLTAGKTKLLLPIFLLALVALNAWLAYRRFRSQARKYLETAFGDSLGDAKADLARAKSAKGGEWLSALEDSLYSMGEVLLGSNPRGITRTELESHWREQRLPPQLYNRLALVLDRLDQSRFSTAKNSDLSQRLKLQQEVDEILREASKVKRAKKSR